MSQWAVEGLGVWGRESEDSLSLKWAGERLLWLSVRSRGK